MTSAPDVTCEKSARRKKRSAVDIQQAMERAAGLSSTVEPRPKAGRLISETSEGDIGLTLRALEEDRWQISPAVAKVKLRSMGLPYEGRKAGILYSWQSIFRAEGLPDPLAKMATREGFPDLFFNLLDTAQAAALLGYKDPSSIRKMVGTGEISSDGYVQFGSRGVYRFRPATILALGKQSPVMRIV